MNQGAVVKVFSLCVGLLTLILSGCTQSISSEKQAKSTTTDSSSHGKDANQSASSSVNGSSSTKSVDTSMLPSLSFSWPSFSNNAWQDRYSPDSNITSANVNRLALIYQTVLTGSQGVNETYPLEDSGVIYVTTSMAHVMAIHAESGKVIWQYLPKLHLLDGIPAINRGVALGGGYVYVLTPDDRLIALDKQTGLVHYDVSVADESKGYFESMAPIYANGTIVVGSSGGDEGIRGFVAGYDAKTGTKRWQFYTIPQRGQGWVPKSGEHGGGAVWTTPAFNPDTQSIYFGTGNPSPDYFGESRPGSNPYTDSVVSVNISNGQINWYQQEVTHDLWDYDVASPPILFPGRSKSAIVGEAGKDGYWYEWDADTGKSIIQPVAFVRQGHSPPTSAGVEEWPGTDGGANYGPSAYNPNTNDVYIAGINGPETVFANPSSHTGYRVDLGTYAVSAPKGEWTGNITAIHTRSGQIDWQFQTPTPPIGGVTANAGGIVFFGQPNGMLVGLSAITGEKIWQYNTGASIASAPILFQIHGKTYISVVTGAAGSLESLFPWHGANQLLTFCLD